jgi:hypothetical protein
MMHNPQKSTIKFLPNLIYSYTHILNISNETGGITSIPYFSSQYTTLEDLKRVLEAFDFFCIYQPEDSRLLVSADRGITRPTSGEKEFDGFVITANTEISFHEQLVKIFLALGYPAQSIELDFHTTISLIKSILDSDLEDADISIIPQVAKCLAFAKDLEQIHEIAKILFSDAIQSDRIPGFEDALIKRINALNLTNTQLLEALTIFTSPTIRVSLQQAVSKASVKLIENADKAISINGAGKTVSTRSNTSAMVVKLKLLKKHTFELYIPREIRPIKISIYNIFENSKTAEVSKYAKELVFQLQMQIPECNVHYDEEARKIELSRNNLIFFTAEVPSNLPCNELTFDDFLTLVTSKQSLIPELKESTEPTFCLTDESGILQTFAIFTEIARRVSPQPSRSGGNTPRGKSTSDTNSRSIL